MMELQELRSNFVPINVLMIGDAEPAIGTGSRILFWVAGNGRKTAVFNTMGEYFVISNSSFKLVGVYGSSCTEVRDGRIHYKMKDTWFELGGITPGGVRDEDISIKDAHAIYVAGIMDCKQDFDWDEGDSFD